MRVTIEAIWEWWDGLVGTAVGVDVDMGNQNSDPQSREDLLRK